MPLIKFAYNDSYQTTIKMTPYKAFYDKKCISPLHYNEIGKRDILTQTLGFDMTQRMIEDVRQIWERMKQAQDHQKSYVAKIRKDLKFVVCDKVFVKVAPYKHVMRFDRKGKLTTRFIGPF